MRVHAVTTTDPGQHGWRRLATIVALLLALPFMREGRAQNTPVLRLPLECAPARSCWISNHVDLDPGPGVADYACGLLSYNGHDGTDFAIRDLRAMAEGVRVLAAAPGTVAAVRDGEPDISVRQRGIEALDGRDCGNGVRIRHENGWQTQYCHLLRGSITVKPGDTVAAGDSLGKVGLSGRTEYPHLHFTVRRGARVVDPFRGEADEGQCGPGPRTLWDGATLAVLAYAPGSIYNFGIAAVLPQAQEARAGVLGERRLPAEAPMFAVWAEVFGVDAGDTLAVRVEGPDGSSFISHQWQINKRQARIYRSLARKRGAVPWPRGPYKVRISLARAKGDAHSAADVSFVVDVH